MIDSLEKLITLMKAHGAQRMYAKLLSANDNSKNQIYLGSNYSTLNIIPNFGVHADTTLNKQGSVRERFKADINFNWIDESGIYHAPDAQLILYPKYPEVRLSGILRGCANAPSEIIAPRMENRILFLEFPTIEKYSHLQLMVIVQLQKSFIVRYPDIIRQVYSKKFCLMGLMPNKQKIC